MASLHLSGFSDWVANHVILHLSPRQLLPGVIFTSGILSALLVNDVVCQFMAPLILEICKRMGVRFLPYLLALATASNIGGAATIPVKSTEYVDRIYVGRRLPPFFWHIWGRYRQLGS